MFIERMVQLNELIKNCSVMSQDVSLSLDEALQESILLLENTKRKNGIVYVIGNGGSAGIASHFCNDLMKSSKIPSQTLYDTNLMTCLSNDIGYDKVFSYPLERLLKSHDCLVAISSSGNSANITSAAQVAQSVGAPLITLSGFKGDNKLRKMGQLNFWLNAEDYGLVETGHFFLLHTIIDAIYLKSKNTNARQAESNVTYTA